METILKATNVIKKYGNKTILNGINMNIKKGDIYGFIGKNGAGKTTFMRTILGLTQCNSGDIELFDGKNINEVGLKIGSLIESPGLYKNLSAYDNMKMFGILYNADNSKINDLLNLVGLNNVGKRKVKNFSLGMKQRLGIAISLLGDPEFLILDEPINGLDPEGIKDIRDAILKLNKEKGITFLISSHLLDELSKIVTRYGIINDGMLIEEIEAERLKEKCKSKLIIEVDNINKSKEIIKNIINEENIVVNDSKIILSTGIEKTAEINKELVISGINVNAIYANYDSLEDYFMRKIGE